MSVPPYWISSLNVFLATLLIKKDKRALLDDLGDSIRTLHHYTTYIIISKGLRATKHAKPPPQPYLPEAE